ncbi:MAG TPA: hypothetical protein VMJ10_23625 [Kofleriaceae bacterium]|nr:hypothetical protein [Kofleriaceae bacterium]
MKSLACVLFASALVFGISGCENTQSKLDQKGGTGGGSLEERLAKLEADNAKYHDELEWLNGIYKKQQAQQQAQEDNEPDPNATFAVDIAPDLKLGQVEGPPTACVTLVEAWDFA